MILPWWMQCQQASKVGESSAGRHIGRVVKEEDMCSGMAGKQTRSGAGVSCARLENRPCGARERSKARESGHSGRHGSCQRKMGHRGFVRPRQGGAVLLTNAVAESGMRCVLERSRIGAQGGGKQESKIESVSYNSGTQMIGGFLGRGFATPASSQSGDG